MDEVYVAGFMDKCAQFNVDPVPLVKEALVSPSTGGWRARLRRFVKAMIHGDPVAGEMETARRSTMEDLSNLDENSLQARLYGSVNPNFREDAQLDLESLDDNQIREILKLVGAAGAGFGGGALYTKLNQ